MNYVNYNKINTNEIIQTIRSSGFKLTKQRIDLVHLLFGQGFRHISAEVLHAEALENNLKVSLATVYNTLKFLYEMGLINEIKMFTNSIFDTNCQAHAHILDERTGDIKDLFFDEEHIIKIKEECSITNGLKGIDIIFKVN